jgi:hypothetical protein
MSTRNIPGIKGDRCVRLTTSPPSRAESGSLNFLEPSGQHLACYKTLCLLLLQIYYGDVTNTPRNLNIRCCATEVCVAHIPKNNIKRWKYTNTHSDESVPTQRFQLITATIYYMPNILFLALLAFFCKMTRKWIVYLHFQATYSGLQVIQQSIG